MNEYASFTQYLCESYDKHLMLRMEEDDNELFIVD